MNIFGGANFKNKDAKHTQAPPQTAPIIRIAFRYRYRCSDVIVFLS
jgi:hypothetical protein